MLLHGVEKEEEFWKSDVLKFNWYVGKTTDHQIKFTLKVVVADFFLLVTFSVDLDHNILHTQNYLNIVRYLSNEPYRFVNKKK